MPLASAASYGNVDLYLPVQHPRLFHLVNKPRRLAVWLIWPVNNLRHYKRIPTMWRYRPMPVVASQWQIGDRNTVQFIEAFYRELAARLPAGDALHAAKLDALRRGASVGQWAAFTLVGDPLVRVPLQQPRRPWGVPLAGLALVLSALACGWVLKRRRA